MALHQVLVLDLYRGLHLGIRLCMSRHSSDLHWFSSLYQLFVTGGRVKPDLLIYTTIFGSVVLVRLGFKTGFVSVHRQLWRFLTKGRFIT